jgi:hypothetical protein
MHTSICRNDSFSDEVRGNSLHPSVCGGTVATIEFDQEQGEGRLNPNDCRIRRVEAFFASRAGPNRQQ